MFKSDKYIICFVLFYVRLLSACKRYQQWIFDKESCFILLFVVTLLFNDQCCLYLLWPTNEKIIEVMESSSHREQKCCSLATESNLIDCRISLTAERNFRFRFMKQNSSVRYLNNVYHEQIELCRWKTEMKSTSMHRNRRDNRFVVTWRNYFRNRPVFRRSSKIPVVLFNSQRTKSANTEFLRFNLLLALADKKRSPI